MFKTDEERLWSISVFKDQFNRKNFNNRVLEELQMLDKLDYRVEDYVFWMYKAMHSYFPSTDINITRVSVYKYFSGLVKQNGEEEIIDLIDMVSIIVLTLI